MKRFMIIIFLLLSGCSTVNNTYEITGDNNRFETDGSVIAPKEVSTAGSAYGSAYSKEHQ